MKCVSVASASPAAGNYRCGLWCKCECDVEGDNMNIVMRAPSGTMSASPGRPSLTSKSLAEHWTLRPCIGPASGQPSPVARAGAVLSPLPTQYTYYSIGSFLHPRAWYLVTGNRRRRVRQGGDRKDDVFKFDEFRFILGQRRTQDYAVPASPLNRGCWTSAGL